MKIKLFLSILSLALILSCNKDDDSGQSNKETKLYITHNNKIIYDGGFLISKATTTLKNDTYQNSFDLKIDHDTHIFDGTFSKIPYGEYTLETKFYENDKIQFYADTIIKLDNPEKTIDNLIFKKVNQSDPNAIIKDQFLSVNKNRNLTITLGPDKDTDGNSITYIVTPQENFTWEGTASIVYKNNTVGNYSLAVTAKETNNKETSATITIAVKEPVFLEAPSDVLFVGNSLTHPYGPRWGGGNSDKGAVKYHLQQIYNELNLANNFVEAIRGGASLKRHYGYNNPPNPDTPGNTYEIDSIKAQHNITVLQPSLDEPFNDLEDFKTYGKIFIDLIRAENSIPILFHPWALKNRQRTYEGNLRETTKLCDELGVQFVDVGAVVHQIYLDDTTPDKALYHRLYAGDSDNTHLSIEGMYMVGLSFAKFFTGVNAIDINYRVEEADIEYANMIKRTVDQVITNRYQN
ncbi:Ig-like domain-containing protein [Aquimarina aquimarini]|uniref:Ig-like domain-containing protein n=1 Tax=Aquimarina aquimarini TaxID=1191734 RepID=UPI00131F19B5|nr:hypothetical protein [Aquimarina aquimarini]